MCAMKPRSDSSGTGTGQSIHGGQAVHQLQAAIDPEKQALAHNHQQDILPSHSSAEKRTLSPSLKYLIAVTLVLLYISLPLPGILHAGSYLSASSSSAISSLLSFSTYSPFSTPAIVEDALPCAHSRHHRQKHGARPCRGDNDAGYAALLGHVVHRGQGLAEQGSLASSHSRKPLLPNGPRDARYNKKVEDAFVKIPNNESCIEASRSYTGISHIAGKDGDFHISSIVKKQWEQLLGLPTSGRNEHVYDAGTKQAKRAMLSKSDGKVRVFTQKYYVLLNHPAPVEQTKTSITLSDENGKQMYKAKLQEDALVQDPTSMHGNSDVPPFHGYSKAGTANGQLVYAHSGTVEDFKRLKDEGIDMTGKIAMVRYGGNFRGLKVKAAQEAGAIGCIIYSDPAQDGEVTVDNGYLPYPAGPARQPSSLQRGSVQFLSKYPGDPTTPGRPSYKDAKREESQSQPDIPSLPLSYEDAIPLLRSLNGRGPCIEEWKGGLGYQDVSYCSGPSAGKLSMTNDIKEDIYPIWNTYARIEGHIQDEVVIIGNHRDAWVFGAVDPNSGTATMHEIVKGLGELLKQGWRPLRTILIASWDAEEYGLVGSTEFGEDFAEYSDHVVAYLNVDSAAAGSMYSVKSSPSLADLFRNVSIAGAGQGVLSEKELDVGPLGSGSDYTVFLQHLGIASSDMSYHGKPTDPVYHYHSIYDSETWVERYGDPGFTRHVIVAKILGLATLRLADSAVLPINITHYSHVLEAWLADAQKSAEGAGFGDVDFSKTLGAIKKIQTAAAHIDTDCAQILDRLAELPADALEAGKHHRSGAWKLLRALKTLNGLRMGFEGGFISEEGLPRREWYKHLGVAPGENLGYGATTFPGVTEAATITADREALEQEVERLTSQLEHIAKRLRSTSRH